MEVEVRIDNTCKQPKVVVHTAAITEEVAALLAWIQSPGSDALVGFCGDMVTILDPAQVLRLYAEKQKVYADTQTDTYAIRMRLYEAENRFCGKDFVRISHSEIINLRQVTGLDLSLTGTICIRLANGKTTYVSRRYLPKIKTKLGL